MPAITLILGLVSVGLLCRALFKLAVHALPFFVAVSTGMAVLNAGIGIGWAFGAGLIAAVLTLAGGQFLFAASRSMLMRGIVAAAFLVPAVVAGHHAAKGLALLAGPSEVLGEIIGWSGAFLVGAGALHQLLGPDLPRHFRSGQIGDQPHRSSPL